MSKQPTVKRPKGKKVFEQKAKRQLMCKLNDQETMSYGRQLANLQSVLNEQKEEAKRLAADQKARIQKTLADIQIVANKLRSGTEERPVDCTEYLNAPESGMKVVIREDTEEQVAVEAMTFAEKQPSLPGTAEEPFNPALPAEFPEAEKLPKKGRGRPKKEAKSADPVVVVETGTAEEHHEEPQAGPTEG